MKPMRFLAGWLLCLGLLSASRAQESVVLNELVASNASGHADEAGEFEDWIELFNPTGAAIDIGGWTLSDDAEDSTQFVIPLGTLVPADGYLVLWADKDLDQGALHLPFKLDADGEWLGLWRADGTLADSVGFGPQTTDRSLGRVPDGAGEWMPCFPTPLASSRPWIAVQPSHAEGVYGPSIDVSLSLSTGQGEIRYTLDGRPVSGASALYQDPLPLSVPTVVRARGYLNGQAVTEECIRTYIVNDAPTLSVVSVVTAPEGLWDPDTGIYTHPLEHGEAWERESWITLIEQGETRFSLPVGLRIHGRLSRDYAKKGFRLVFRKEYGCGKLPYALFDQKPDIQKYDELVLSAASGDQATGNTNYTYLSDVLGHTLFSEMGGLTSAFKPVALYLNGAYWGFYWLREYIGEDFLASNCGVEDADLLRDEQEPDPVVRAGDASYWYETMQFFRYNNMADSANYQLAGEQYLDLGDFTDYHILNFYSYNYDWLDENIDRYRSRTGDPRWRWILWDTDAAWRWGPESDFMRIRLDENDPYNPYSPIWYNLIIRRLFSSSAYKIDFVNRYADLINTTLSTSHVLETLEALVEVIRNEMPREEARWRAATLPEWAWWEHNVGFIQDFARRRPDIERAHLCSYFSLPGILNLTVAASQGPGRVQVSTVMPESYPFSGVYFQNVPIPLRAIPDPGCRFVRWSDPALSADPEITLTLYGAKTIYAVFEPVTVAESVVINEICAVDTGQTSPGDWVELYNAGQAAVDLSGWWLEDENQDPYIIPQGITLPAGGYQVLAKDTAAFHAVFPQISASGPWTFGLKSEGERIALFTAQGGYADTVRYGSQVPWPEQRLEIPATLALDDPQSDNALAEHWRIGYGLGTPGRANHGSDAHDLVINEFNYNSRDDVEAGDWVELYNPTDQALLLGGWGLADGEPGHLFVLPQAVEIPPKGYWVLVEDSLSFSKVFPACSVYSGCFGFGLSGGGETLYLFDDCGVLIDSVFYDDKAPWPEEADGEGPSLELIDPALDNSLRQSWQASQGYGSPGAANDTDAPISGVANAAQRPVTLTLFQNHPNPFNGETMLSFALPKTGDIRLAIYDLRGRRIRQWRQAFAAGTHQIGWDGRDGQGQALPSGVYLIRLEAGRQIQTRKMLLLR